MAAQRRIDLVLDSVRRLLRVGATANLLNLLQKQHPADLAQVFKELTDRGQEVARDACGHVRLDTINPGKWFAERFASLIRPRSCNPTARCSRTRSSSSRGRPSRASGSTST